MGTQGIISKARHRNASSLSCRIRCSQTPSRFQANMYRCKLLVQTLTSSPHEPPSSLLPFPLLQRQYTLHLTRLLLRRPRSVLTPNTVPAPTEVYVIPSVHGPRPLPSRPCRQRFSLAEKGSPTETWRMHVSRPGCSSGSIALPQVTQTNGHRAVATSTAVISSSISWHTTSLGVVGKWQHECNCGARHGGHRG
jgi:hypothetical protein